MSNGQGAVPHKLEGAFFLTSALNFPLKDAYSLAGECFDNFRDVVGERFVRGDNKIEIPITVVLHSDTTSGLGRLRAIESKEQVIIFNTLWERDGSNFNVTSSCSNTEGMDTLSPPRTALEPMDTLSPPKTAQMLPTEGSRIHCQPPLILSTPNPRLWLGQRARRLNKKEEFSNLATIKSNSHFSEEGMPELCTSKGDLYLRRKRAANIKLCIDASEKKSSNPASTSKGVDIQGSSNAAVAKAARFVSLSTEGRNATLLPPSSNFEPIATKNHLRSNAQQKDLS